MTDPVDVIRLRDAGHLDARVPCPTCGAGADGAAVARLEAKVDRLIQALQRSGVGWWAS
jgi:hypothetical protein